MEIISYDVSYVYQLGQHTKLELPEATQQLCLQLKKQNNVCIYNQPDQGNANPSKPTPAIVNGWRDGKNLARKKVVTTPENPQKKELYLLLNKLSDSNYETISRQFTSLIKLARSESLYGDIVDRLFQCAVAQVHFCPYYAKLCKYCLEGESDTLLVGVLVNKISTQLDQLQEYRNTVSVEDYNSFCEDMSWKNKHIGCYQFIAELYNYRVVGTDKMLDVITNLVGNIEAETVKFKIEILVEAFNKLLGCICEATERVDSDCQFLLEQGHYLLDSYGDKMNMRSQIILENQLEKYDKIIPKTD